MLVPSMMYYVMKNVNHGVSRVMVIALMAEDRIATENAHLVSKINGCVTITVSQLRHLAKDNVLKVIEKL